MVVKHRAGSITILPHRLIRFNIYYRNDKVYEVFSSKIKRVLHATHLATIKHSHNISLQFKATNLSITSTLYEISADIVHPYGKKLCCRHSNKSKIKNDSLNTFHILEVKGRTIYNKLAHQRSVIDRY